MAANGLQEIPAGHLPVCGMGKGADTCRYLVMEAKFACAKRSAMKPMLDARVAAGTMSAQGDNCPGGPFLEKLEAV